MSENEKPIIQDIYYLENLEQLQVISDPIRYRMAMMMVSKPMTGAQLARALKISRARAHYHLKLLEKASLVVFWDEDPSSGIIEKYYRTVGRMLDYSRLIFQNGNYALSDDLSLASFQSVARFLATLLDISRDTILHAEKQDSVVSGFYFDFASLLTPDQISEVRKALTRIKLDIITKTGENEERLQNGEQFAAIDFRTTLFLTLLSDEYLAPHAPEAGNGPDPIPDTSQK